VLLSVEKGVFNLISAEIPSVSILYTNSTTSRGACIQSTNGGVVNLYSVKFGPITGAQSKPGSFIYTANAVVRLSAVDIPSVLVDTNTDPSVMGITAEIQVYGNSQALSMCDFYANTTCISLSASQFIVESSVLSDVILSLANGSSLVASDASLLSTVFSSDNSTMRFHNSTLGLRTIPSAINKFDVVLGSEGSVDVLTAGSQFIFINSTLQSNLFNDVSVLVYAETSSDLEFNFSAINQLNGSTFLYLNSESSVSFQDTVISENSIDRFIFMKDSSNLTSVNTNYSQINVNRSLVHAENKCHLSFTDTTIEAIQLANSVAVFAKESSVVMNGVNLQSITNGASELGLFKKQIIQIPTTKLSTEFLEMANLLLFR